jgi:hypothetical protein
MSVKMTLEALVAEYDMASIADPLSAMVIGSGAGGEFLRGYAAVVQGIEFMTRFRGVPDFGPGSGVRVTVPPVNGMMPVCGSAPMNWSGMINCGTADTAVAEAFELIAQCELLEFLNANSPSVIFDFIDSGGYSRLKVTYDGTEWVVDE